MLSFNAKKHYFCIIEAEYNITHSLESKKKILAVINPISGTDNKEYVPETIVRVIDSTRYDVTVRFTNRAGHATELTREAIRQGFFGVIAIGGDGTINEVASALTDTDVALGIVPCGSGNGLARHLGIPLTVDNALQVINEMNIQDFDYCKVNDVPFFCTCGVGFDAHVSDKFAQSTKRGPVTYVKKALAEYLKYRCEEYEIELPDNSFKEKAFVIACGNASQYGNNAMIAPHASMHDGLIDVTVIHPFTPLDTAMLSFLLFTGHIDQDTNIHSFRTSKLTIRRPKPGVMHIDGEPMVMPAELHICCIHNGLKIFMPVNADEPKRSLLGPLENSFWNFVDAVRNELNI